MRTIIFLDVDGVLNCETTKDKCGRHMGVEDEKVRYLKEIVDFTNGEIVLSSSWRLYWDEDEKKIKKLRGKYLTAKLKKFNLKPMGKTPDLYWARRGEEILEWLKDKNDINRVIILDDEYFAWKSNGLNENWVCTIDGDWDMWNLDPGLMPKHVDFIKNNIEQFTYSKELVEKRQEEYKQQERKKWQTGSQTEYS